MALLNPDTLQELIDTVGLETSKEIAEALRSTLADFHAALPTMSRQEMGQQAHTLKGSTSYLGTEDLYLAAIEADRVYKSGGDIATALNALDELIQPSLEALDGHLR